MRLICDLIGEGSSFCLRGAYFLVTEYTLDMLVMFLQHRRPRRSDRRPSELQNTISVLFIGKIVFPRASHSLPLPTTTHVGSSPLFTCDGRRGKISPSTSSEQGVVGLTGVAIERPKASLTTLLELHYSRQ